MEFYKTEVDTEMFNRAMARALGLPEYELNFKQHLQDADGELQAKVEGSIGELIFEKWLKVNSILFADERSCTSHDYVLSQANLTAEVKTKVRQVEPEDGYECSIPEYIINIQTADIYAFISLTQKKDLKLSAEKYTFGYVVGVIAGKRFKEIARYFRKGEIDPKNNYPVKKSCYNVFISEMTSPRDFPPRYWEYCNSKGLKLS